LHVWGLVITVILFIIGLAGTVLPVLPGVILIYLGMIVYGLFTGFVLLDVTFFVVQGVVTIVVLAADQIASVWGTKAYGGSKQAAWGAIAGALVAIFVLGPLGFLIGPVVGAVLVELLLGKSWKQAFQVGVGTLVGLVGGTLVKLLIEMLMIIYFFMNIF